jgi:hypothetical protein
MVHYFTLGVVRQRWSLLAGTSAWILTLISGFWRAPPIGSQPTSTDFAAFAQFFLTLVVGLILILVARYSSKAYWTRWAFAALVLVLLTPVLLLLYEKYSSQWSTQYANKLVLVGPNERLTDKGKSYLRQKPNITVSELVFQFAGVVDQIWEKDSIENRHLILEAFYIAGLPLLAASIICVLHAAYCANQPDGDAAHAPDPEGEDHLHEQP